MHALIFIGATLLSSPNVAKVQTSGDIFNKVARMSAKLFGIVLNCTEIDAALNLFLKHFVLFIKMLLQCLLLSAMVRNLERVLIWSKYCSSA